MSSLPKQEKNSFPPISNRQKLSTSSNEHELDKSTDSYRKPDSGRDNEDTCASPVFKLPTIERTKSRSISSISSPTSTLGSRQFSRDSKPSRRSICRSPSCPSNIGLARSDSINKDRTDSFIENRVYNHFPQRENEDDNVKLPSIFRNASSLPISPRNSSLSNKWKPDKENGYVYSLRRTESFQDSTKETINHEQQQTHALLLPMRNVDNVSRAKNKKKKKFQKSNSESYENTMPEKESSLGRWSGFENDQNKINGSKECLIEGTVTDRSVEMVSARKMKKWMKQHPSKEGQVKA